MNRTKIESMINKGLVMDGTTLFTVETVLDTFKLGIELGSKGVGMTTNFNHSFSKATMLQGLDTDGDSTRHYQDFINVEDQIIHVLTAAVCVSKDMYALAIKEYSDVYGNGYVGQVVNTFESDYASLIKRLV